MVRSEHSIIFVGVFHWSEDLHSRYALTARYFIEFNSNHQKPHMNWTNSKGKACVNILSGIHPHTRLARQVEWTLPHCAIYTRHKNTAKVTLAEFQVNSFPTAWISEEMRHVSGCSPAPRPRALLLPADAARKAVAPFQKERQAWPTAGGGVGQEALPGTNAPRPPRRAEPESRRPTNKWHVSKPSKWLHSTNFFGCVQLNHLGPSCNDKAPHYCCRRVSLSTVEAT
jgi:hypothetical protein